MSESSPEFREWLAAAAECPIEHVVDKWKLPLVGTHERVGPCPHCGGEDRFGVNLRRQVFRCRQCGAKGDVIDLVRFLDGCNLLAACQTITGQPPPDGRGSVVDRAALDQLRADRQAREEKRKLDEADYREAERIKCRELWDRGVPAPGTPVESYLRLRGVSLPPGAKLRFLAQAPLYQLRRGQPPKRVHTGPAMIAAIVGPGGRFAGIHTTWLDLRQRDGKAVVFDKATGEVLPSKKVRGSLGGGHLKLAHVENPRRLVIGEGIETVLSVREALLRAGEDLAACAFWAGISLDNLGGPAASKVKHPTDKHRNGHRVELPGPMPAPGGIPIPDSVVEAFLLGDGDSEPFLTRTTLERASRRWSRPGRVIRGPFAPTGLDFNSYHRGQECSADS